MLKRTLLIKLFMLLFLMNPLKSYSADDVARALNSVFNVAGDSVVEYLNKYKERTKWVEGEFNVTTDGIPEYTISAFTVIDETDKQLIFNQSSIAKKQKYTTLNVGFGFRNLILTNKYFREYFSGEKVIVGLNVFQDMRTADSNILQYGENHRRFGIGAELKTGFWDFYFNRYIGQTGIKAGEKVLNGYDYGFEGVVPKIANDITFGLEQYKYNGDIEKRNGIKSSVTYHPNSLIDLKLEHDARENGKSETSLNLRVTYQLGKSWDEQIAAPFVVSKNVWNERYDQVIRNNTVYVESHKNKLYSNSAVVTPNPLSVTENLSSTFTIKMKKPIKKGKLVLDLDSSNKTKATLSSYKLTFTDSNWNTPQTVTITAKDDADTNHDNLAMLIKPNKSESTGNIKGMGTQSILLKVLDDDKPATTDTLSIAKMTKTIATNLKVSKAEIKTALSVSGGQTDKADWVLSSLNDKDSHAGVTVTADGLSIGSFINPSTTITATFTHSDYLSKSVDFELQVNKKTGVLSLSSGSGLSVSSAWDEKPWGTNVQIPTVTGGGTGTLSYAVTNKGTAGNGVAVSNTGLVSGSTAPGTVTVRISRAGDSMHTASTKDVTITFTKQSATVTVATPSSVQWGTNVQLNPTGGGTGSLSYTVTDKGTAGNSVAVSSSGLVTGSTAKGTVKVRVTRASDSKYNASSANVTVTFTNPKSVITASNKSAVWGNNVTVSASRTGTGAISFEKVSSTAGTGVTVNASTGVVSGSTQGGTVVVKVKVAATASYESAEKEVTVTFNKKAASVTVTNPSAVLWGTNVQIATPGGTGGTVAYTKDTDSAGGSVTVSSTGLVSGATQGGTVTVKVKRNANAQYNESAEKTVTITFNKKPQTAKPAKPTLNKSEEFFDATITYNLTSGQLYQIADDSTGLVSIKMNSDGSYTNQIQSTGVASASIQTRYAETATHLAGPWSDKTAFNFKSKVVTVPTPAAAEWGTAVQLVPAGGGTGALSYSKVSGSNGAVSTTGEVTATAPGSVVVRVTRAASGAFAQSSANVTVTFTKRTPTFTGATEYSRRSSSQGDRWLLKVGVVGDGGVPGSGWTYVRDGGSRALVEHFLNGYPNHHPFKNKLRFTQHCKTWRGGSCRNTDYVWVEVRRASDSKFKAGTFRITVRYNK